MDTDIYCRITAFEENNMGENISDNWINIEEAAAYLGVKSVTVRNWIKKENGIPAHRIGKLWKFKRTELDAWVKSGRAGEIW